MAARFGSLPAVRRRWAAFAFAGLAAFSGALTYLAMTGAAPFIPPTVNNVVILLVVDLALLVLLAAVVGYRMAALWRERRRSGARLHVRLAVLFTAVALVPAVLVALFTVLFFDYGLHGWFSQRVQTALDRSLAVAEAYLEEHRRLLVSDALAMANDLSRGGPLLFANTRALENVLESHAGARSLSDAQVLEAGGEVLARSMFSLAFSPVPEWALETARRGEVAILEDSDGDRLGALLRIAGLDEAFLYIGRYVDPMVVNQVTRVRKAVAEYQAFEGQRTTIEFTFAMMFATVAALFVFAAIWVGFNMAAQLAEPIMNLIAAANRVREGDLAARVRVGAAEGGEIDALSRAFNRMTDQLGRQRAALIDANLELEERRRFTEAVLAGVAVGVVGLDAERRVNLPNRVASDLLGVDLMAHLGRPLVEVAPAFGAALEEAARRPDRSVETEVAVERNRELRTFQLRTTADAAPAPDRPGGLVLTFADITDLQSAQRMAAWSDVARRIAHEIKNPLTPIQLAAERLRRRYAGQIEDDAETFSLCIDTIVRQVGDMRRMVDEFASFARMPAPAPAEADLADILRRAVFLQREAAAGLDIEMRLPDGPVLQVCDAQLLGQALTNLLLNAVQALEGSGGGRILAALRDSPGQTEIVVEDDGPGFPAELRRRLTEPYVTTKARRGAGLGLAIVKKIVEDQGAALHLEDGEAGGARARIVFRRGEAAREPERGRTRDA